MNKDKKAFIDSVIDNKEILAFTMRDMYESLKSNRKDFYEEVTTDEVLLHMIYDSNIPVDNKRLLFMQLKSFTGNEDIKVAIDTYITRSDFAYNYLSNPDLVYTVYRGNKSSLSSLNNIRKDPGGVFDSFACAIDYIKYFNEKCIKDEPANKLFIDLQFHLLDATVLIRGDQYKSEKDNTACSCILGSNGELLQVFFDNFKPKEGTDFPDIHPLFNKSYSVIHNFTVGDIVRPRWDIHNFNFLDNGHIYFVKIVDKSSKIILTCYDQKNKVIYDIDHSVSPFSLSMEYPYTYEDDAYLFDFIIKYQSYLKGYHHYDMLDIMNSFYDCNMKGNN